MRLMGCGTHSHFTKVEAVHGNLESQISGTHPCRPAKHDRLIAAARHNAQCAAKSGATGQAVVCGVTVYCSPARCCSAMAADRSRSKTKGSRNRLRSLLLGVGLLAFGVIAWITRGQVPSAHGHGGSARASLKSSNGAKSGYVANPDEPLEVRGAWCFPSTAPAPCCLQRLICMHGQLLWHERISTRPFLDFRITRCSAAAAKSLSQAAGLDVYEWRRCQ